jgi:hypothetical protein
VYSIFADLVEVGLPVADSLHHILVVDGRTGNLAEAVS